jgi:SecD/SecF fusion protein
MPASAVLPVPSTGVIVASASHDRAAVLRAAVALLVVGLSLYAALTREPKLGLDLRGGTQIVLETSDSDRAEANAESTGRTVEVLRGRVDALGVSEPTLARSGENRIIVELPGVQDPTEAARVIGRTAQLSFHPVLGVADGPAPDRDKSAGTLVLPDEDGQVLRLDRPVVSGEQVGGATAAQDTQSLGQWVVNVEFAGDGGDAYQKVTADAACRPVGDPRRRVAIVLDEEIISSPQVDPSIACGSGIAGGSTQITGGFTQASARDLAILIEGGALPLPVEIIEQRTVGPTLGAEAIAASARAAIIGVVLTTLFITLVYRLTGLLAAAALACYALLSYAVLVTLGATLTLPGLAGFVLAIGMAIDANVLVFERAREEYGSGRIGLARALKNGFAKAWTAILDSNVTTLLSAGLLFLLASGPVRGFGVTLSIGVLASMVSALVIARVLTETAVRRSAVRERPRLSGLTGNGRLRRWLAESGPQIMSVSGRWVAVAAAVVVVSLAGVVVRGLDLGVEFTGGRLLEYSSSSPVDVDVARDAVSGAGFPTAVVQSTSDGGETSLSVRTGQLSNAEATAVEEALDEVADGGVTKERDELIGPSLGAELRNNALIALGVALGAQLLYLAVRFRWTYGLAAMLAMLHDVAFVVGVFAWFDLPVDGIFLAAALTIIGLSVNDTVVVFDRVRELRRTSTTTSQRMVNDAVLQTVPRTINTGLGAMFILGSLALLGGDSLTDFAIALLLGLIIGTWSSVFTASPLLVLLERRWPDIGDVRATPVGRQAPSAPVIDRYASVDPYAGIDSGRGEARN